MKIGDIVKVIRQPTQEESANYYHPMVGMVGQIEEDWEDHFQINFFNLASGAVPKCCLEIDDSVTARYQYNAWKSHLEQEEKRILEYQHQHEQALERVCNQIGLDKKTVSRIINLWDKEKPYCG